MSAETEGLGLADMQPVTGWGHGQKHQDGKRRWGARKFEPVITIAGVDTCPFGELPRVVNMGTAAKPNLWFTIPQGAPGSDAQVRGLTLEQGPWRFENGLVKSYDPSAKTIRTVSGFGEDGINIKVELTPEGALTVNAKLDIDFEKKFNEVYGNIEKRVADLESGNDIKQVKEFIAEMRERWIQAESAHTLTKMANEDLLARVRNLTALFTQLHPELTAKAVLS